MPWLARRKGETRRTPVQVIPARLTVPDIASRWFVLPRLTLAHRGVREDSRCAFSQARMDGRGGLTRAECIGLDATQPTLHQGEFMRASIAILFLFTAPAAFAQEPPANAFDFKGIKLGMDVEELKQFPYPETGRGAADIVCTGARDKYGEISDVAVYGDEKEIGVTRCKYKGDGFSSGYFSLANSGYASYDYTLKLIRDPQDGVTRLYEIMLPTNADADAALAEALTDKFGKPASVIEDTVQNRLGATFPRVSRVWANSVSSVTSISPSGDLDDMVVLYQHTRLAAHVATLKSAAKKAKGNGM